MESLKERMAKGATAVRRPSLTKSHLTFVRVEQPEGVILCKPFVSPVELPKIFPYMLRAMPIAPAPINAASERVIMDIHATNKIY